MNFFSGKWRPTGFNLFNPGHNTPYNIVVKRIGISCKPGKHPTLYVQAEAWPLEGGKSLWSGALFFPFNSSDRRAAEAASLVEFYHATAGMPLRDEPDWEKLSRNNRWKRFVGRLSRRGDFMNLVSIQTTDEFGEGHQCFAWTTDGGCFPAGLGSLELISIEDFGSCGQSEDSEPLDEDDPVIPDDDDPPMGHGRPSVSTPRPHRKPVVTVIEDEVEDDGL